MLKISTFKTKFIDSEGRERIFNGMNLCDKLAASLEGREINHAILAVDDSFVAMGEQGKSILQTAGIDACAIKKTINDII